VQKPFEKWRLLAAQKLESILWQKAPVRLWADKTKEALSLWRSRTPLQDF
jgi:hypothetical protein